VRLIGCTRRQWHEESLTPSPNHPFPNSTAALDLRAEPAVVVLNLSIFDTSRLLRTTFFNRCEENRAAQSVPNTRRILLLVDMR
jgi:hypothetical protein